MSTVVVGVQSCGCITLVDAEPDRMGRTTERALAKIIRNGGSVRRATMDEVRDLPHFLPVGGCPHEPKGWEFEPREDPEPKVRFSRVQTRGVSRVYVKTEHSKGYPVGEVRKWDGKWWATEGWFNHGAPGAHDGTEEHQPCDEAGPFDSQKAAAAWLLPIAVHKSRQLYERMAAAHAR